LKSQTNGPTRIWTTSAAATTGLRRADAKWRKPKQRECVTWFNWRLQDSGLRAMPDAGVSFRFYRWLLRLYPAGFRENYAASLERQFLDELSDSSGRFALVMLWIRIFRDLSISVPVQAAREVMRDSRHALRLWRRRPLHTGFAIGALAIGIGANTGVFSVVNALLLRSLPFRDPDRLIVTHIFIPPSGSAKQFHDWRQQSSYLEDAAIIAHGDVNLAALGNPPESIWRKRPGTSFRCWVYNQ